MCPIEMSPVSCHTFWNLGEFHMPSNSAGRPGPHQIWLEIVHGRTPTSCADHPNHHPTERSPAGLCDCDLVIFYHIPTSLWALWSQISQIKKMTIFQNSPGNWRKNDPIPSAEFGPAWCLVSSPFLRQMPESSQYIGLATPSYLAKV